MRVYGFRFSFTPLAGVLFAFPSRYFCAIGRVPYLALDRGRPGFRRGFSCPAVLRMPLPNAHNFGYGAFTPSGRLSQNRSPIMDAQLSRSCNPALAGGLGSSDFARRYFRNHFCFLFPGYLDGSVPPVSPPQAMYSPADNGLPPVGLPHSATGGSRDVCSSPPIFAACRGLLRQNTPRHSP